MRRDDSLACAVFLHRIGAARVLREHQFWDAVRLISDGARHGEESQHLQDLVDEDALVDAVLFLGTHLQPRVRAETIRRLDAGWNCQVKVDGYYRRYRGQHADLAAALLTALVRAAMVHQFRAADQQCCGPVNQRSTVP